MGRKKIVIALSGGIDSCVTLHTLLINDYEVHCVIFEYGSKHNKYENQSAHQIVEHFQNKFPAQLKKHVINLTQAMNSFSSSLLQGGEDIPEGHYAQENMRSTVVPGRNLIFISILAGLAESLLEENEMAAVAIGVHQGDHFIYPDCRREFIMAANLAVYLSSDKRVEIVAPLINDYKIDIVNRGLFMNSPLHLTRTCYKDQPLACGKCGSCNERLEAFAALDTDDPIEYEESI